MDGDDYYYSFQSEFEKFSEPRLLSLVEFFRELYFRRKDLFRKIFPQLQDQFLDVLKKFGMRLWRVKSGNTRTRFTSMRRSLSLGSPRSTGVKEVEPQLWNEWIKVRTINSSGSDQQGGSGGQANDSKSSGATK